jgi:hypothetical protein
MVIHYLDIKSIGVDPTEADPPLVVDPNAVLPGPVAAENLQPIPWNRP